MNTQDGIALTGKLTISLNDEIVRETDNLIVTVGKEWVADRMEGVTQGVMTHMGVGTGTTDPVIANTALETQKDSRVLLQDAGGTVVGAIITFACTFPSGNHTDALTEAGIFNAASAGAMLARTEFPVVNKEANDSMTISWAVTIS